MRHLLSNMEVTYETTREMEVMLLLFGVHMGAHNREGKFYGDHWNLWP